MAIFLLKETYTKMPISCSDPRYKLSMILRLLSGTIDIQHLALDEFISPKTCYIDVLKKDYKRRSARARNIYKAFGKDLKESDYYKFLVDFQNKNIEFFENLKNEIISFIWYYEKKEYTTSFIYVYRILEYISMAFPLIYVANSKNFNKAFVSLKDYFTKRDNGDANSELKFFSNFIELAFCDDDNYDTEYCFNFIGEDCYKRAHYKLFTRYFSNIIENKLEYDYVTIKWQHIPTVIINIRNHYFHFDNSVSNNITPNDLIDPDSFFKIVNVQFIRWLSSVYISVCSAYL